MLKNKHEYFMKEALKEAEKAFGEDEVPVGAIVTINDKIIARAHNQTERLTDVTAHAEMIAITSASNALGSKYLDECAIYITIEPCLMCATALFWSKINNIFYGASDEKYGYSTYNFALFNKKTKVRSGLLEGECAELMKVFFRKKRDMQDLI